MATAGHSSGRAELRGCSSTGSQLGMAALLPFWQTGRHSRCSLLKVGAEVFSLFLQAKKPPLDVENGPLLFVIAFVRIPSECQSLVEKLLPSFLANLFL